MEHKRFIVLAICLLVSCGQANPATEKSTSNPIPLNGNDLNTQTPPTTTTSSTTTTSTTTPSTTTPSATTPSTTTPSPPTSTPSPVTTTPKPEPKPEKGMWAFSNSTTNETCIILQMSLQFNISYKVKDGGMSHAVFNLPVNKTKTKDGSCGVASQNITLAWLSDKNDTNMLMFNFDKNTTTNKFSLSAVMAIIYQDNTNFPQANETNKPLNLVHTETIFNAPLTMSYRCGKEQNITLNGNDSLIFINDVQIQAFHADKGVVFGSAVDCDYVDVPDIVPIAVGCALGALVLIVLIAYLVGRRRNRARGYLSM